MARRAVIVLPLVMFVACAAPADDPTRSTTTPEETTMETTPTESTEPADDETTESTEPTIPVTTTTVDKKGGLPVPPEPSIPPPRY
jgi:hypothetical protein